MAGKGTPYLIRYEEIEVTVTPKRVKMLRLRVKKTGSVVEMSVPLGTRPEVAERFVKDKIEWIRAARKKAEERPENKAQRGDNGTRITIFDDSVTVFYVEGHNKACREGNTLFIGVPQGEGEGVRLARLETYLRRVMSAEIERELPVLAARVGVKPSAWQVRKMTSRWGSCHTGNRKLTFNTNLVYYPRACLTYVMVHELCHLHIAGHGKKFWALVEKHLPAYRIYANILKGKQ